MSDSICDKCRLARQHAKRLTPQELEIVLTRTGLIVGWREDEPVITALLLPRCGIQHFAGTSMTGANFVFWDQPVFRCPWADPAAPPAILRHGPAVFTPDGRALVPMRLDEQGCCGKATHCRLGRLRHYFIKPFVEPALPRRRTDGR